MPSLDAVTVMGQFQAARRRSRGRTPVQEASPQMPSNHTTPLWQIRRSNRRLATQVRTREVRPDVTVPRRTHPQEAAEIDVPHTSCILAPTMANRIRCDPAIGVVPRLGTAFVLTCDSIGLVLVSVPGAAAMAPGGRHAGGLRRCDDMRI